jgi:hypothetical protein
LAQDIQDACNSAARLKQVFDVASIDERTLQRWSAQEGLTKGDGRPTALHPTPSHALSADERAKLVNVVNEGMYVSPQQRHDGEDSAILGTCHALYTAAKQSHTGRWSGNTRNWQPIGAVTLNPKRDSIISEHALENHIQQLAA